MKKLLSAFTSAALCFTTLGSIIPASAAAVDVNARKFTHQEWTGKGYTDVNGKNVAAEDVFAINREAASVNPVPYQNAEAAANAVWDYNARENSDYLQMLTGDGENWDLKVVQNASQAQPYINGGFMNSNYSPSSADGWKTVQLPKSWTCQGFDFPIYDNVVMPWQSNYDQYVPCPTAPTNYNPVGLYRKKFTVDSSMKSSDRHTYIQFDGVESAYYVYVNGKEVGYSEDTFSPHRFDITDYLVNGENTLAVEVHKFCDGTWFEGQDMIYDGGIFRDVFLVSSPNVQISDYTVHTDLDSSYKNAELQLSVDVKNLTGSTKNGWTIQADAYDEAGNNILSGATTRVSDVGAGNTGTFSIKQTVNSPKLWSAETPNIYALVLTLKDESGKTVECVSTQLGFREIEFTSTEVDWAYKVTTKSWKPIIINGKRLLLKGVNRHDTDPFNGKAVPQDVMEEDIRIMQRNNINAIRTSHYSNDSYLYWLCNKYGMYVMGETNMESHAIMNDNDAKARFYELGMDRTETAYQRLKNNPSIVAWSIGNEMAYTSDPNASNGLFRDMIWYFKRHDSTRPVHSEGQGSSMGVDMGSNMYPGSDYVGMNGGNGKIPYVMCEYDHAMGNSVGALKEYMDAVRSSDNMLGGFIWDFVDQSRAVSLDKVGGNKWDYYSESFAHKNLYAEESKGKFFGYGGDWGDKPNDNSFCENGIISPDRTEQPEIAEVKYQYQDFWFSADASQLANKTVSVYNENNFTNLNEYRVEWSLIKNGIKIDGGILSDANAAPLTKGTLKVPFTMPSNCLAGDEFYLNLSVFTKKATDLLPADTELSYAQIKLDSTGRMVKADNGSGDVTIVDTPDGYVPVGRNFNFMIDKSTGLMKSYVYNGETLISNGPAPNFWRGNVENDGNAGRNKNFDTNWAKAVDKIYVDKIDVGTNESGEKTITSHLTLPNAGNTKVTIEYTIYADGKVDVDMNVDAVGKGMGNFLRIGSQMVLPEGAEQVSWYGNGPVETFSDRKTNGRQGVWSSTVSEMFYPYMKADDTGTLTDVKWISVKNPKNESSVLISAEGTVEASALHFYPKDFDADHVYQLTPHKETVLSVNYGSMGTGSATCGQGPLNKYQLPSDRQYEWKYTIIPAATSLSDQNLTDMSAKLRSNGVTIQDKSHNNISVPVTSTAKLKETSTGNALTGKLDIPTGSLAKYVEGNNSFTVEVNVVPTGNPEFNMFAGKGDYAFALRTESKGLIDFFVYAGGAWRPLYCKASTDSGWIGQKHQVAGIYDAENGKIKVYVDGKIIGEGNVGTTAGVAHSDYNLTLGACPETGRSSQAEFYDIRIYSKALSEYELASQNTSNPMLTPDNKDVQLWLDFDNVASQALVGDINADGSVDIADLTLLQKYILCKTAFTAEQASAADLNFDGSVDIFDSAALRKTIIG